jgi:hypothetical protein
VREWVERIAFAVLAFFMTLALAWLTLFILTLLADL